MTGAPSLEQAVVDVEHAINRLPVDEVQDYCFESLVFGYLLAKYGEEYALEFCYTVYNKARI